MFADDEILFEVCVGRSERWVFVVLSNVKSTWWKRIWFKLYFANVFPCLAPDPRIIRAMLKTLT